MNIYIRKTMLFISYTAFVIIAPVVILYAIGYRPQSTSGIPRSVGVILADATPNRANVSINGVQYGTLPRSVPNIDPGLAHVQITKEGYTSWEKQMEVKATQATDIRSVQLLPSTPDTEIFARNIIQFASSPNNLYIAAVTNTNSLIIFDETGVTVIPAEKLSARPIDISWSPDNSHLLVTFPKNTYQLFRVNTATLTKIPSKALTGLSLPHWSPTSVNTIYGLDQSRSIISYMIATNTTELIREDINLFTIAGRTLYYQSTENELGSLQLRSEDSRVIIPDTGKAIKKISAIGSDTLAILFADGELIIHESDGQRVIVSSFAEDMSWSPDDQLLLVQTAPTELSLYNFNNERLFAIPIGELRLITRLTQPVTNPQWFSDSLHIMYHNNNNIVFSEIDIRDRPIAQIIESTEAHTNLSIGDKSQSIIYIKKDGASTSLVQTWLVTKEDR